MPCICGSPHDMPFGTYSPCPWRTGLTGFKFSNDRGCSINCAHWVCLECLRSRLGIHTNCTAYWGRRIQTSEERQDQLVSSPLPLSSRPAGVCWRYKKIWMLSTWTFCKRIWDTSRFNCYLLGLSVKGFECVVGYENAKATSKLMSKIENLDLLSLDQAMFCTHLSHFGILYNRYQEYNFYGTLIKICSNHC